MSRSVRVGRIAGVPISVDAGLAVLTALFVVTLAVQGFPRAAPEASLTQRLIAAGITVGLFLASTLAHELAHATVAKRQGVGVRGITLTLFGGYARLDRQAPGPGAEFAIAAAGPAANLAIGGLLAGVTVAVARQWPERALTIGALAWLAGVNIVLALLNLLPASPLDGGRILVAALWRRLGEAELARVLAGRSGLVLSGLVLVAGLVQLRFAQWQGAVTLVVAAFLFIGARDEIRTATIRRRLNRTASGDLMVSAPPSVADSLTADELLRFAGDDRKGVAFPVVRWSSVPIGYVIPARGSRLDGLERSRTRVGELMQPVSTVARAWSTEALDDVLEREAGGSNLMVVVHEPAGGRVVGTITETQIDPLLTAPDLWGRDRTI